jgi:hypothetical protein
MTCTEECEFQCDLNLQKDELQVNLFQSHLIKIGIQTIGSKFSFQYQSHRGLVEVLLRTANQELE